MECFYLIKDYRILSYFFINITFFYSTDCEECKLEYVDNCLIHPLIPIMDTQVNITLYFDLADSTQTDNTKLLLKIAS